MDSNKKELMVVPYVTYRQWCFDIVALADWRMAIDPEWDNATRQHIADTVAWLRSVKAMAWSKRGELCLTLDRTATRVTAERFDHAAMIADMVGVRMEKIKDNDERAFACMHLRWALGDISDELRKTLED